MNKKFMIRRRCKCGCGEITNYGKKYIHGHNWEGKKHSNEAKKEYVFSTNGKYKHVR